MVFEMPMNPTQRLPWSLPSLMGGRWLRAGSFAALDQAWLSIVNLLIAILFIRTGDKAEYGIYLLLMTPVFLMQGAQNALLISPFATLYPAAEDEKRGAVMRTLLVGQLIFILCAGTVGVVGLAGYVWLYDEQSKLALYIGFFIGILGLLSREAMRAAQYSLDRPGGALHGDIAYGLIVLVGLGMLFLTDSLTAALVFSVCGLAGLFTLHACRSLPEAGRKGDWSAYWACGRWSLIGVGLTWVSLNIYPWVVGAVYGTEAVAEINAARLFLMPFALCLPAWSNLVRPRIARWFKARELAKIRRFSLVSCLAGIVAIIAYASILLGFYSWFERLLGAAYSGLSQLVFLWALFFAFSLVRTVLMASAMVDANGYRLLSLISFVSLLIFIPGMYLAVRFSYEAVLSVMVVVELLQMLMTAYLAFRYWNMSLNESSGSA